MSRGELPAAEGWPLRMGLLGRGLFFLDLLVSSLGVTDGNLSGGFFLFPYFLSGEVI